MLENWGNGKSPRLVLAAAVFLILALLASRPANAEMAIGVGLDMINQPGTESLSLRYDYRPYHIGAEVMVWDGPERFNNSVSLDFNLARWPLNLDYGWYSFDVNLGAAYLARTTESNGTFWNFYLRGAVNLGEHFRIFINHISHGRDTFGIEKNKANDGWNFLGVAYRF